MNNDSIVPGRFAERTVIVTGAGSGIGRASAVRLAAEGARVIATDVSRPRLDELAGEHPDLVVVPGDITDPALPDELLAAAGGSVHALANIAGIMDSFLPPAEIDDALWDRVLTVNLTAPMRLIRAVLPGMLQAGSGAIVNVSSVAGTRASASGTAYSASKHALNGLTKSVAFFYGTQGIRCNAVAPGAVMTNIEAPFNSEYAESVLGPIMGANIRAFATPEQLAATVCYLASDDASFVNGAIVACDGGWTSG